MESSFYERVVEIMQNREKSIQECAYYYPKNDREEQFNQFLLNTLAKYIHAYDTLHLIKQHFTINPPQNAADLLEKLHQNGEQQLAKAIALLINGSTEVTATVSEISKQLQVLKGNRIIADEVAAEKKVKRLVSILNALECYIIRTASERQLRPKEYQPKQLKKCEVDRSNYLGNMAIEMKKIEDYRQEALTLRSIISKQYKIPPEGNVDSYCDLIQQVLPQALQANIAMQQVQKAIKQAQSSKDQMRHIQRQLQQLKQTRLKDVLLKIVSIWEISCAPAKLNYARSMDKNGVQTKEERESYGGKEKQLKQAVDRLVVQNQSLEKQLLQSELEKTQLKQQLLNYFNPDGKKITLPNTINNSALKTYKQNFK